MRFSGFCLSCYFKQVDSFDQGSKIKTGTLPYAQLSPMIVAFIQSFINARVMWMHVGSIKLIYEISKT